MSYKDPEHGRKVWVELAQRPGPAPGPAKMKERGEREKDGETIDKTLDDRF